MGRKSRNKRRQFSENISLMSKQDVAGQIGSYLPRRAWIYALAAAIVTFMVYIPSLYNDFLNWDDQEYVTQNISIRSIDSAFLRWIFGFHSSNWHPLTWLSHALDYSVWGLNPLGHHLSNNILHSANVFLLCMLLMRLMPEMPSNNLSASADGIRKRTIITAGLTSLLFGIIPVHVESVAWVAERKDVLSTFFVLLSLLFYVRYIRTQINRYLPYLLSFIFFILALLSKPMAVTLPVILVLLDIYPYQRLSNKNLKLHLNVLIEKMPFFLLSAASVVFTLLAQETAMRVVEHFPLMTRVVVAFKGIFYYLVKMLFPYDLSPFYPYPKTIKLFSFEFFFPLLFFPAVTIWCFYSWKKGNRLFLTIWAFYLITLSPVLGIIKVGSQAIADRYAYIPSIGPLFLLCLGVAIAFERLNNRYSITKGIFVSCIVFYLIFTGVSAVKQIAVWKSPLTLWTEVIKKFPDLKTTSAKYLANAYNNRAEGYSIIEQYDKAIQDFDAAISIQPDFSPAYYNRAIIFSFIGNYQNSLKDLEIALQIDPAKIIAYYQRAIVHVRFGNFKNAVEDLNRFIPSATSKEAGNIPDAYYNRAVAYIKLENFHKGIEDLNNFFDSVNSSSTLNLTKGTTEKDDIIQLNASKTPLITRTYMAYLERAAAYMKLGNYKQAVEDSKKAIGINPGESKGYAYLATVYFAQGDFQKAIDTFSEGIKINPNNFELYGKRGTVHQKIGKSKEAIQDFQKAAQMGDPRSQEFLNAQGITWR